LKAFKAKVEEVRALFVRELAKLDKDSPTHRDNEAQFVPVEEIAGQPEKWEFLDDGSEFCLYAVLRMLSLDFEIEEEGGGFFVSVAAKHTTEIADGGASLYYVIRRNGQEIGRSYAGSWDDDFGDQNWDEHEITKESARERMGDEYYEWAVKNGKSVRYDEPLPSLDIKITNCDEVPPHPD